LREESAAATGGWFRFRFPVPATTTEPWAMYLWWLNLNGAFYFNGVYLGDGGRFTEPIARNWNKPFFFVLPDGLWKPGQNEILIRIRSDPGWGILSPIEVGPISQLRPDYDLRRFFQVDLTRGLTLTLLVAASLVLAVWWRRRHDPQYFWFGLACLMWGVFSTYLVVRDPPIPGPLFRWISHLALDAWAVCMALFVHRYLGIVRPRLEKLLAVLLVGAGALTAMPELIWQGYAFAITHTLTFLIIAALALRVFAHWHRGRWREHGLLGVALAALLLAGLHDLLLGLPFDSLPAELTRIRLKYHFIMLHLAAPVVLLFLTGHLGRRFADALNDAETLNRELESRVAASSRELSASYDQRSLLERETATAEERERIYRDLHDDIGAKLLSLAIRAKIPEDADIARSALQDLRDVVSRSSRADAPLTELLADWRAEIEGRCSSAGIRLAWNQPDDIPQRNMTAAEALNLGRILRESVSNVLRHANAHCVVVGVHFANGLYQISVEDDGHGKPRGPGRGMRNMLARAAQLGGAIEWIWGERGCRVVLQLPAGA
jgi:signal transduction histidine kinase